jgi:DNA processing protein
VGHTDQDKPVAVTQRRAAANEKSPAGARLQTEEQLGWLALKLTDGLGPKRIWAAVAALGSAGAVLHAALTALEGAGLPASAAQAVHSGASRRKAEDEWKLASDAGARIVVPTDEFYPQRLLEIYDPPVVLWCLGDAGLLSLPGIAVVGTRQPTPYGSGMARMLSRDLAARGLVILSGMARGVDTCAHEGALEAHGKTIAVWGTGVDVIYPKENKQLAERILAEGGAILSEFPMTTFPAPQNFPIRNRILSGMSVGVLVVEAGENSGTRITARCALEQNREVFAIPGNVTNKQSWGPNTLIKQGAKLTATWEDVWEDLPTPVRLQVENGMAAGQAGSVAVDGNESNQGAAASLYQPALELPPHEAAVYAKLRKDETTQLDELIEALEAELSSAEIFAALFELELAGRVRMMPGKNYVKSF